MGNTITYAKQYINNQSEVLRMFNTNLLCADLLKPLVKHEGKTVSYDRMSFASYVMGTYNRETGLSKKDIVFERVDRTLTQDRGDSLGLDVLDKNEAQIADGLVGIFNFYNIKVAIPSVDDYAFGKMGERNNQAKLSFHTSLSASNILGYLFGDFATLKKSRIKIEECIVFISATNNALLEEATFGKGILQIGNWNGNLDVTCTMIKNAKLVEVPDDTLGAGVNWIICHPLAVDVVPVLAAAELKENIPGYVGRSQIDVRHYFDAWIQPNGEEGILVSLQAVRAPIVTLAAGKATATGFETGGKIYYTNAATPADPTSASTEYTAGAEISVTSGNTIKFIQYVGTNASAVVSATNS